VGSARSVVAYLKLTRHRTDNSMKGAAFIADALLDPVTSHSEETSGSHCLRLFKTRSYFDYLYASGNEYKGVIFHAGMGHVTSSEG